MQNIFLVTPPTTENRIRKIDNLSNSFIYIVSSNAITGGNNDIQHAQEAYFKRIQQMQLKNPTVIGFGIKDNKHLILPVIMLMVQLLVLHLLRQ